MSKSSTTTEPMALEGMRRPPTHPGALLADMLRELDVSAAEVARRIGVSKAQLSHVQTGLRPMPHTMCVKLAALLGTSAEFWASLQMRYDLWHALHDKATRKAVKAIEPLVAPPPHAFKFREGDPIDGPL